LWLWRKAGFGRDVDLLVDFEDDALERGLSDLVGCPVDVLDAGAFEPARRVVGLDNAERRERIRKVVAREVHALR
jgi:hypothetical protein